MPDITTDITFRRDLIGGVDWAFLPGEGDMALCRFTGTGSIFLVLNPTTGRPRAGDAFTRVTNPAYDYAGTFLTFKDLARRFVDDEGGS